LAAVAEWIGGGYGWGPALLQRQHSIPNNSIVFHFSLLALILSLCWPTCLFFLLLID